MARHARRWRSARSHNGFSRRLITISTVLGLVAGGLTLVAQPASAAPVSETTGGVTHTWTNYTNAGGTEGPTIPAFTTVQITCALSGFRVADGNTWWYQIASSPWNNTYFASADAFYNNGQTSGSLSGTPFVDQAVPLCGSSGGGGTGGGPPSGTSEQEGPSGVNTFANYQNASGFGQRIAAGASVVVSCKVYAPTIASVSPDGYWYLIASSPWNNQYYAPANTFMNGDPWGGPYTHPTDYAVPDCGNAPRAGTPTVSVGQGPAAPYGFRYAISLAGFSANTAVSIECFDSVSAGGFYEFTLTTNASGSAFTQSYCYSGDGPDHWVVANGLYASNRVSWGSGGAGGTAGISSVAAGVQGSAPPTSQNSTTCSTPRPVNCASGAFWHTFPDFTVPGRGVALTFSHTYSSAAADVDGPLGYGWTDSYNLSLAADPNGNITVNEETGASVSFSPNGSGGFTAPARVLATLAANSDGTFTFTRIRSGLQDVFSAQGRLLRQIDRNGYVTSLTYTGGQLTSITDPAGRSLALSYAGPQVSQISDPMGRTISFTYDAAGNLATETTPTGGTWSFAYDPTHLLLTMTDPRGGVTTNAYDSSKRVVKQTDPAGLVTSLTYAGDPTSGSGGTTTLTDPNGDVTSYSYQNLELLAVTHAAGTAQAATTSYTYDASTLGITSVTDPNGHATTYAYDALGNQVAKTDPLGRVTSTTYNALNEPTTVTDPSGGVSSFAYDSRGNLTSKSDALHDTATLNYGDSNHPGDLTSAVDPVGRVTSYTYDNFGNVASTAVFPTNSITDTTMYAYDLDGERTCIARPNAVNSGVSCPAPTSPAVAGTTATTYDSAGQVLSVTDPLGHTTSNTYDALGNLVQTTDPLGHATQYSYDADNRRVQVVRADGGTERASYDANGNVLTTTDANAHATSYRYDALNERISTTNPLGRSTTYRYDLGGNRVALVDAMGRTTSYSFDAANELTAVAYSDGTTPSVSYGYDANGRRQSMTDGSGTTNYNYDAAARLTKVTNGAGQRVTYVYDASGRPTSVGYPNGKAVSRTYDGAGELTALIDWLGHTTRFTYDPNGNLTAQTAGSAPITTDAFTYDASDAMTSSQTSVAGGSVLQSLTYTRNANSQVATVALPDEPTTSYGYAANNRLASDDHGVYGYDAAGNIASFPSTSPATYDSGDELGRLGPSQNPTTFTYDPDGDRLSSIDPESGTSSFAYDQTGRLVRFNKGHVTARYAYDGDGLRTTKTVGSTTNHFAWDASSNELLLSDGTSNFIYGPGTAPVESITNDGVVAYYHHDQLGSTTMLTSLKGTPSASFKYLSYGTPHSASGSAPLLYGGQYFDAESGLYYLRARFYDPATAQFLTVDPLVSETHAAYSYAGDDPVNATDPSGGDWFSALDYLAGFTPVVGQAYGFVSGGVHSIGAYGWATYACLTYGFGSNTCSNANFDATITTLGWAAGTIAGKGLAGFIVPSSSYAYGLSGYSLYSSSGGSRPYGGISYGTGSGPNCVATLTSQPAQGIPLSLPSVPGIALW